MQGAHLLPAPGTRAEQLLASLRRKRLPEVVYRAQQVEDYSC